MSGQFYGADVEQLRELAALFESSSDELSAAVALIGGQVDQVPWFGPSSEMFVDEWHGMHRPGLQDAASSLLVGADALRRNADEQEVTSTTLYGDGASGFGTNPFAGATANGSADVGGGWAQSLTDLIDGAAWVGSAASTVQFGAELIARYGMGMWNLADSVPFLGAAGTALAWAGVGFGAFQMGQGIAEGDWWKVGDGAITTGLGIGAVLVGAGLVSNPVGWAILGAGAAWALTDFLVDGNITEAAWNLGTDVASWAGDRAADAVGWVGGAASDVWDGAAGLAGDVWDAGGSLLSDAGNFVGGLLSW